MNKAVFDIGINNINVYVFNQGTPPRCLYKTEIENRLGENLEGDGNKILPTKVIAVAAQLNRIMEELRVYEINEAAAFGTEIFRCADNAETAAAMLTDLTGISITVLSPEAETQRLWQGLVGDFDWDGQIAAVNIGGGLVKFMYGTCKKIEKTYSFQTGVSFFRHNSVKSDSPALKEYEIIEKEITEKIKDIKVHFPKGTPFVHGTASALDFYIEAGLDLEPDGRSPSHPYRLRLDKSRLFYEKLRFLPQVERALFFPSHPTFTDIASVGLASVILIGEQTGLEFELPSNNSLVHGFL